MSTRWDGASSTVVAYEKHAVAATEILGGADYELSPALTEYEVAVTGELARAVNARNPAARLSLAEQTNKLAVCLGDGAHYEKHIDNLGGDDRRKVTCLLYLNPTRTPTQPHAALGGQFRAFDQPGDAELLVEPCGGRLVCFWSDALVHDVLPSAAPAGDADFRWALTVWLGTTDLAAIASDPAAEKRHWPDAAIGTGIQVLAG
mmetsp:Transcript_13321/g.31248  ORF Transcript_13321/g.31248 Transcript_13321/m.31248 type:complete len:204 (+) Transcript_13321:328-939(+)